LSDNGNDRGIKGRVKDLWVIIHPLKSIETSPIALSLVLCGAALACAACKFTHSTSIRMILKALFGPDATTLTFPIAEILFLLGTGKSGQFGRTHFYCKGIISFLDGAVTVAVAGAVGVLIERSVPLGIEARLPTFSDFFPTFLDLLWILGFRSKPMLSSQRSEPGCWCSECDLMESFGSGAGLPRTVRALQLPATEKS
jgi:hypothetical protein